MLDAQRKQNLRRYPRRRVVWPAVVEAGKQLLHGETMDVGPQGAKLRLTGRLEVGTRVQLHLTPTQGRLVTVEAIVWRIDDDGLAFFFLSTRSEPDKPEEGSKKEGSTTSSSKPTETILVVDDEPEVLSLAADTLEMKGYTVLKTMDSCEALDIVRRSTRVIHLLLTDILMPPMNGMKLADELRATRPALRVLLMSAYTPEQAADYGVGLVPGIPLLVKPFGLTELHSKVRAVLDYRSPFSRRRLQ
jgi:CheY-like chemotaxis protein